MNLQLGYFMTLLVAILVMGETASAQFGSIRPRGMRGSAGFGFADYTVLEGANSFKMNNGMFTTIQGEGEVAGPLFATLSLNYLQTDGRTDYKYSTLSQTFSGTDLGFNSNTFQIGLGLKVRPFDAILSPYAEAGGLIGYYQINYQDAATKISPAGDYRTKDGVTELGYYGDAGIEVNFTQKFGVKVGYRYHLMETRSANTLSDRKIKYESRIIHFGIITQF